MIEKGIGIKWLKFGTRTASPQIPDVSGMQYEQGYKMAGTPSAKLVFSPSNQPNRLSSTFIGDFEFPPWKGREGDWIGGDLHQDRRLRDLDFKSHLHSLSQGTLIPDLIRCKRLGHDFEIPSVEMLHYLSRSNAQSLDWIGWRLSQGPRLGLLSAHTERVRYASGMGQHNRFCSLVSIFSVIDS